MKKDEFDEDMCERCHDICELYDRAGKEPENPEQLHDQEEGNGEK